MADWPTYDKSRKPFPVGPVSGTLHMAPRPGMTFDPTSMTWIGSGARTRTGTMAGITARKGTAKTRTVFIHTNTHTFKETEVWVLPSSRLECGDCHESWCKHIQAALIANADGDDLWDNLLESYEMEIPMIPTAGQWVHVILEPALNFNSRVFEVVLGLPDSLGGTAPGDTVFIGHIHPGEGRMVIRSMIFDWFRGHVDLAGLECHSSSHKMQAEAQWQNDMKQPETAVTQQWSVWASSQCRTCAAGMNNFDDLVPEAGERESVF